MVWPQDPSQSGEQAHLLLAVVLHHALEGGIVLLAHLGKQLGKHLSMMLGLLGQSIRH